MINIVYVYGQIISIILEWIVIFWNRSILRNRNRWQVGIDRNIINKAKVKVRTRSWRNRRSKGLLTIRNWICKIFMMIIRMNNIVVSKWMTIRSNWMKNRKILISKI